MSKTQNKSTRKLKKKKLLLTLLFKKIIIKSTIESE